MSDTGMRLAEAAGLSLSDFNLQADIPFVEVRKHPWRSLKASASARVIPLSGMALWAANRILQQADTSHYAFPRYNRGSRTSANSASVAINNWLRNYVPEAARCIAFDIQCGTDRVLYNALQTSPIKSEVGQLTESRARLWLWLPD